MTWREYHECTKHSVESLERNPHFLDWANMPNPFRHYESVPLLDLPSDPPVPETPALDVLRGVCGATPAADGPAFLSELLFYSAAISASKSVPSTGLRYALRVNPSSGNLHPTEFHFLTRGLKGLARWALPLPTVFAHGGTACARPSREEAARQFLANRVRADQHYLAGSVEVR